MAPNTNNISFTRGATESFEIGIVDENGEYLSPHRLKGATAQFILKTAPDTILVILSFDTTDPVHLELKAHCSKLRLSFLPADTSGLALAVYTYKVGVTLADGTPYDVIEWSIFDINLGGISEPPPPVFNNTVKVDHNWQLPDNLRYVTPGGTPIADAQIRIYYKSDYDAGRLEHPIGITQTNCHGRWAEPLLVLPGYDYTIRFEAANRFGPDVVTITA